MVMSGMCHTFVFQSAPPTRGATVAYVKAYWQDNVSIRAPHAGGDPDVGVSTLNS